MTFKILVPEMGESILEATVSAWLKDVGDAVTVDEPIVEIETEKANQQIVAEKAGVLVQILHPVGDDVHIGDVLGQVDEAPGSGAAATAAQPQPLAQATPLNESPAPDGATGASAVKPSSSTPGEKEAFKVTPVAQRMAKDLGVDLAQVQPAGPGKRITKEDINSYIGEHPAAPAAAPQPAAIEPAVPQAEIAQAAPTQAAPTQAATALAAPLQDARVERIHMTRRRQTIARRMLQASQTTAMLTTFNEVNMEKVMALRQRRKEAFKAQYGISLGIVSFFVKAAVAALKAFPRLNAEIQGDEILLKHYYDIGLAVGAPQGLVVPVLRAADSLSFAEIEQNIRLFVQKAESNTFSLQDLSGGTFTISNGGVYGSLLSTPILNPPEVAILGLHKIQDRPIALDGAVVVRPMMYMALSYDHRIVDGQEAVQFLVRIKELIEDPERLLLEA
jgi:2-oxoglutarate dehydrogenase E2 component (dihydrolipoamide succinyltransferase)